MLRRGSMVCVAAAAAALVGCGDNDHKKPAGPVTPTIVGAAPAARFFSADSAWNRRADGMPTDPDSAELLRRASQRVGAVEPIAGEALSTEERTVDAGVFINTQAWTPTIVSGGVETRVECRQQKCGANIRTLHIPANVDPDPRYDGWFTVISSDGRTAYDLWRARRERDSSISYQFMRSWNLQGPGAGAPTQEAARGSGLPLFAGAIRQSELSAGNIDHALAIAVPGPARGRYVRPASVTNGNGALDSLPEGARIRLKGDIRLGDRADGRTLTRPQQRARDAILVALRRYGAIVVDRAAVPTLYVERGVDPNIITGDELSALKLSDFDVTEMGTPLTDPPASGGNG